MRNLTEYRIMKVIDSVKNWSSDCPFKIEVKNKIQLLSRTNTRNDFKKALRKIEKYKH